MNKIFNIIYEFLEGYTGLPASIHEKLLSSILSVLILILLRIISVAIFSRTTSSPIAPYRFKKGSAYVATFLAFLLVGRIWFHGMELFATFPGFLSAGLAIALQELVKGVAGWIYVLRRHPFRVGDRIQIGDFQGDVIDSDVQIQST